MISSSFDSISTSSDHGVQGQSQKFQNFSYPCQTCQQKQAWHETHEDGLLKYFGEESLKHQGLNFHKKDSDLIALGKEKIQQDINEFHAKGHDFTHKAPQQKKSLFGFLKKIF